MSWAKLDDAVRTHPKMLAAGAEACWMWACGLSYSAQYLTDGFIPRAAVAGLYPFRQPARLAARLVEVGLWEAVEGGYRIHDYHDYNPTAEKVKEKRAKDAKRKRGDVQAESSGDSTRTPRGLRTDSTRNPSPRARAIPSRPVPGEGEPPHRGSPSPSPDPLPSAGGERAGPGEGPALAPPRQPEVAEGPREPAAFEAARIARVSRWCVELGIEYDPDLVGVPERYWQRALRRQRDAPQTPKAELLALVREGLGQPPDRVRTPVDEAARRAELEAQAAQLLAAERRGASDG